jgi:hypothetical protein
MKYISKTKNTSSICSVASNCFKLATFTIFNTQNCLKEHRVIMNPHELHLVCFDHENWLPIHNLLLSRLIQIHRRHEICQELTKSLNDLIAFIFFRAHFVLIVKGSHSNLDKNLCLLMIGEPNTSTFKTKGKSQFVVLKKITFDCFNHACY